MPSKTLFSQLLSFPYCECSVEPGAIGLAYTLPRAQSFSQNEDFISTSQKQTFS